MQYQKCFLVLIIFFILWFDDMSYAASEQTYFYYIPTLVPKVSTAKSFSGNLEGLLGEGWSSDNNAPVGQCLSGTIDHVGTPAGSVSMDTIYSYDDVMNQLNFKLDSNFLVPGFKIDASTNYAHLLKDTDYSQTFIYRASINLKNRHFVLSPDKSPLTWVGQQYANDPVAFRAYCGDKFISEQQIGGALYVAIKFLFHTKQEKFAFNSSLQIALGSLARLNSNIDKAAQAIKADGSISVMAFQIGGDPIKLGQILGAPAGSTEAPLLDCELNNLDACKQMINQILIYASQPSNGNFPTQFTDDDPQAPIGPGVIQNILQNYATAVPVKIGPSLVTQEIVEARARVSQKFEQSIIQTNEINELINENIPLSPEYAEKLATLKANVNGNDKLLRQAGLVCYEDDLSRCLSAEIAINMKLLPVDLTPLKKRIAVIGANEDYLFPYSAQKYIYARGNNFYRDEIFTLSTLTPEQLTLTLPTMLINATSQDQGITYQGMYRNNSTGYTEKVTLIPDFKMSGLQ